MSMSNRQRVNIVCVVLVAIVACSGSSDIEPEQAGVFAGAAVRAIEESRVSVQGTIYVREQLYSDTLAFQSEGGSRSLRNQEKRSIRESLSEYSVEFFSDPRVVLHANGEQVAGTTVVMLGPIETSGPGSFIEVGVLTGNRPDDIYIFRYELDGDRLAPADTPRITSVP